MLKDLLYVAIGGGVGSAMRYFASRVVMRHVSPDFMFVGTLLVNISGCLLIGLLSGWMLARHPENQSFRLLFIVGFCGGYTTFSTFAFENLRLIQSEQWLLFGGYTLVSVVVGLISVWAGMKLAMAY